MQGVVTGKTAVEMPLPWKSQNDFHRSLEISPEREISTFPQAIVLV
jgi:hypothetical protein